MALEKEEEQQQQGSSSPQSVCNRKQHRTTLPTEIINEILLKLPVKSVLICTSVCKSWYSFITDPHFIKSHLSLSAHPTLIFNTGCSSDLNTCCLTDVLDGNFPNANLEVDYPLRIDGLQVCVVGSCNGLLCMYIVGIDDYLFICNPTTRKYNRLPSGGYSTKALPVYFCFGYDASSDDYKVVAVSFTSNKEYVHVTVIKMYSLRDGSWKDISVAFSQSKPSGCIKLLNGVLHWMDVDGDGRLTISSLDIATETCGEVSQPVYDQGEKQLFLGTLGEWLCVICDYRDVCVDLWVLKAYGVEDSWTKLFSVSYVPDPEIFHFFEPVCISNDGKVLFIFGTKLMIYDSNNSSFSDVKDFDEYVKASMFVQSLVSPMPPAAATLGHRVASSTE